MLAAPWDEPGVTMAENVTLRVLVVFGYCVDAC